MFRTYCAEVPHGGRGPTREARPRLPRGGADGASFHAQTMPHTQPLGVIPFLIVTGDTQTARSCQSGGTVTAKPTEMVQEEGTANTKAGRERSINNNKSSRSYNVLLFSQQFFTRYLLRAILRGREAGSIYLHLAREEMKSWDSEVICSRSPRNHGFLRL